MIGGLLVMVVMWAHGAHYHDGYAIRVFGTHLKPALAQFFLEWTFFGTVAAVLVAKGLFERLTARGGFRFRAGLLAGMELLRQFREPP